MIKDQPAPPPTKGGKRNGIGHWIDERLLALLPAAVYVCDHEGVIVYCNQRATELWGRAPRCGETDERYCGAFRLYYPDGTSMPHASTPMAEALRTGGSQRNREAEIERPDGSRISVLVNIDLLRDDEGRLVGAVNVFQDLTSRKQAEQVRSLLASIVESSDDAIISKTLDGVITSWNAAAERLFGYTPGEAIGQPVALIIPPERRREEEAILERLRQGEQIAQFETVRVAKTGRVIEVALTVSPVRDPEGRIVGASKIVRDITERKKSEQARRESEERFRLLADSAPVLIWMSDAQKEGIYFNKPWLEFTGKALSEQLGSGWLDAVHPDDRPALVEDCLAAFRERRSFTSQFRLRHTSGEYRWMLDTGAPRFTQEGRFVGFIGTCVDVTEQKIAEEAAREHEQQLQAALGRVNSVLASITDAYFAVDSDFRFVEMNSIAVRTIFRDMRPSDLIGRCIWEVFPEGKTSEFYHQYYRALQEQCDVHFEARSHIVDRWFEAHAYPRDGRLEVYVRDITERKQAEQTLLESEERFRHLADNIAQFAWMGDGSGFLFWYNRRWLEYTGTTLEEMEGWGWRKVHHPDHVERVTEKFKRHIEAGQPWEDTFPLRSKAGEYRWFLSRAVPIRDEQGRVVRWFGTNTDITERMRMEEALKEADRRKDEFLAMLAHELRNPLAPIRSGLDLLSSEKSAYGEVVDLMQRQVSHLIRLVDDLLDVSRIMRGKVELRREAIQLSQVLEEAADGVRSRIAAQGQLLMVRMPDEPAWLFADPVRLVQVFENLLNNASKYSSAEGRIELIAKTERGEAVVTVRDEGIGIEPELLPNVFELFTQSSRSLDRAQGGLGIGLTLVQNLVQMHRGTVSVQSEGSGRGSTFTVRLPLTEKMKPNPAPALPPANVERRRILVVDDNESAAYMLSLLLTKKGGHQVVAVHDGPTALASMGELRPQIVLLDIGLPGMNGYDVGRAIRQQREWDGVLLVAVTGYGQEQDRRLSKEAGFDEHLVKPPSWEQIEALLIHPKLVKPMSDQE